MGRLEAYAAARRNRRSYDRKRCTWRSRCVAAAPTSVRPIHSHRPPLCRPQARLEQRKREAARKKKSGSGFLGGLFNTALLVGAAGVAFITFADEPAAKKDD